MNTLSSKPVAPVLIALAAAALTVVPMNRGDIRILQALWFVLGFDQPFLAVILHGLAAGLVAYCVFWFFRRRGLPIIGNVVALALFFVYVCAYFTLGSPMAA